MNNILDIIENVNNNNVNRLTLMFDVRDDFTYDQIQETQFMIYLLDDIIAIFNKYPNRTN